MRILMPDRPTVHMAYVEELGQYGLLTEPVEIGKPSSCFRNGMFWAHCFRGELKITHPTGLITLKAGYHCCLGFDGRMYSDGAGTYASIVRWSFLHTGAIFSRPTIEAVKHKMGPRQVRSCFQCERGPHSNYEYHSARRGEEFIAGYQGVEVTILVFHGQIVSVHNQEIDVRPSGNIPGRLCLDSGETGRFRVVSGTADFIIMTTPDLPTTRRIFALLDKPCPY